MLEHKLNIGRRDLNRAGRTRTAPEAKCETLGHNLNARVQHLNSPEARRETSVHDLNARGMTLPSPVRDDWIRKHHLKMPEAKFLCIGSG